MPKCRTCSVLQGYCHIAGILPREGTRFGCSQGNDDKTPLLRDELAKALNTVWDGRFTDGNTSGQYPSGCERAGYTVMLTPEQCETIQAVLARYQEEMGDA